MIYLATNTELPTQKYDVKYPRFHLSTLEDREVSVKSQFSVQFVYYSGSHEGCGCGFQYGEYADFEAKVENESEVRAAKVSRRHLVETIADALNGGATVELYSCWDGDQAAVPDYIERLRPRDLLESRTFFRLREFIKFILDDFDAGTVGPIGSVSTTVPDQVSN